MCRGAARFQDQVVLHLQLSLPFPPQRLVVNALGVAFCPPVALGVPGFAGSPAELLTGEPVLIPTKKREKQKKKKEKKGLNQSSASETFCSMQQVKIFVGQAGSWKDRAEATVLQHRAVLPAAL